MQQAIDILDEMIELEQDKLNDLNPLWKVKQLKERKSVLEKAKSRIQALWSIEPFQFTMYDFRWPWASEEAKKSIMEQHNRKILEYYHSELLPKQ